MGKTIDQHEMIADYLDRMEVEIQGLRAIAYTAAYLVDLSNTPRDEAPPQSAQNSEEKELLEKRVKRLSEKHATTPLLSVFDSEKAVDIARMSLQIHGGRWLHEGIPNRKTGARSVVLPIYEGTSPNSSADALKDQLQAAIKDLANFLRKSALARVSSISARDPWNENLKHVELPVRSHAAYHYPHCQKQVECVSEKNSVSGPDFLERLGCEARFFLWHAARRTSNADYGRGGCE